MYEQQQLISTNKKETGINEKPGIKVCSSIDFYVQQLCVWGGGRRTKRIIGAIAIVLAMMLIVHVLKLPIGFTENTPQAEKDYIKTETELVEANLKLKGTEVELVEANLKLKGTEAELVEANLKLKGTEGELVEANLKLKEFKIKVMENKQVIQHANKDANEKQKQEDLAKMAELKNQYISIYDGPHSAIPIDLGGSSLYTTKHCDGWDGKGFTCNIEWDEWVLVDAFVTADDTVLEFGARFGTTACQLARKTGNSGNVISVEPDASAYESLEANRKKHKCNFQIVKGVVGNEQLIYDTSHDTSYGSQTKASNNNNNPSSHNAIPSITHVEIEKTLNVKINALLIDCEGCIQYLDISLFKQVDLIIIEQDDHEHLSYEPYYQIFKTSGLKCVWFARDTFHSGVAWSINMRHSVWIRPEKRSMPYTCEKYATKFGLNTNSDASSPSNTNGLLCLPCPEIN